MWDMKLKTNRVTDTCLRSFVKLGTKNHMPIDDGSSSYSLLMVFQLPLPVSDTLTSESCHLLTDSSIYTFSFHFQTQHCLVGSKLP